VQTERKPVMLKQADLRLLRKMVTIGLGEGEVPAYVSLEAKGGIQLPPWHLVLGILAVAAPLIWVRGSGLVYAAMMPLLLFALYFPFVLRQEFKERKKEEDEWCSATPNSIPRLGHCSPCTHS